jgi:hypothetical protein
MTWFKPLGAYDNPIKLDGGSYRRDERKRLTNTNRWIGVDTWPGVGSVLKRNDAARPGGKVVKEFKEALTSDGYEEKIDRWDKFDADHVVDVKFSGADDFNNLWPLDYVVNRLAGTWHSHQPVEYSNGPGTPNKRGPINQVPANRFFRIDKVQNPL